MARNARVKPDDAIFHIMCKSIKEVDLFKDSDDKERYLYLVKKYKKLYNIKVYGYCLMDNHAHLLIDPNGADISKVMHGINFSYAIYYNKRHEREGHLFKDRFLSKVVDNDRYLKTVSLYIHNNATDISGYADCPETYAFSSLGIYLGIRKDNFSIVDYAYIVGLFGNKLDIARQNYFKLISMCNSEKSKQEQEYEFKDEKTDYKSDRKMLVRNYKVENILEFIALMTNISKSHLHIKHSRKLVVSKALIVVLMRSLCNFKCSDISRVLGNITQARISKLSSIGIDLILSEKKYENIFENFIECYS